MLDKLKAQTAAISLKLDVTVAVDLGGLVGAVETPLSLVARVLMNWRLGRSTSALHYKLCGVTSSSQFMQV